MGKFLIIVSMLWFSVQAPPAIAKFGETPPVPGKVKCCFGKGGFLSGRCLEMLERDCTLKQGVVVKDCKECQEMEESKKKRK
jgi:hypothetical protein